MFVGKIASGAATFSALCTLVLPLAACGSDNAGDSDSGVRIPAPSYQPLDCSEFNALMSSAGTGGMGDAIDEVREMIRAYGLDPSDAAPEQFNTPNGTRRQIAEVVMKSVSDGCLANSEAYVDQLVDWDVVASAEQFEPESGHGSADTPPGKWTFEKAAALLESLDLGLECDTPSSGQKDVMECLNRTTMHDWAVVIPPLKDAWVDERIDACEFGKRTPENRQARISVVTDGSSLVIWRLMAPEGSPIDGGPVIDSALEEAGVQGLRVEPFCPG